ncbi:P-loop containing nucleoside triphosphate hydrolase protein [Russula aff. rugulosa BPL654]|nr:P-loop containing nucleoside triphosphate hydrolase protein [Russula aff. rugulosa BPL654]
MGVKAPPQVIPKENGEGGGDEGIGLVARMNILKRGTRTEEESLALAPSQVVVRCPPSLVAWSTTVTIAPGPEPQRGPMSASMSCKLHHGDTTVTAPFTQEMGRNLAPIFDLKSDSEEPSCFTKGKDILGAARTGSGKTLCFLISGSGGFASKTVGPARRIGCTYHITNMRARGYHSFSSGIVIGGKNLKDERDRHLLQHMDRTVGFDYDNLQMLVLDKVDRILDMGFSRTLSTLLGHLPKSRQTLLFSATQTQSVSDLARLSLQDLSSSTQTTEGSTHLELPASLERHYAICSLESKIDVLCLSKTVIFLSSAKQVRFIIEALRRLQPGNPLLHLHDQQKQDMRLDAVTHFCRMQDTELFATDLVARGLDFPCIDWVVRADAPEDAATYLGAWKRVEYCRGLVITKLA